MELTTHYYWKGALCITLLHLMLLSENVIGTNLDRQNVNDEQTVEAGISPVPLFDLNNNSNWSNLMLGSRDRVLPFPTINASGKPLKPFLPPTVSGPMSKPQQYSQNHPVTPGGKHPVSLVPFQPHGPVYAQQETPTVTTQMENEMPPDASADPSIVNPAVHTSEAVPTFGMVFLEDKGIWSPASLETFTSGDTGQHSQGGHQAGGNHVLGMNLSGNEANFTSSNNVNVDVISNGTSNSNTYHHFGSKPSLYHKSS